MPSLLTFLSFFAFDFWFSLIVMLSPLISIKMFSSPCRHDTRIIIIVAAVSDAIFFRRLSSSYTADIDAMLFYAADAATFMLIDYISAAFLIFSFSPIYFSHAAAIRYHFDIYDASYFSAIYFHWYYWCFFRFLRFRCRYFATPPLLAISPRGITIRGGFQLMPPFRDEYITLAFMMHVDAIISYADFHAMLRFSPASFSLIDYAFCRCHDAYAIAFRLFSCCFSFFSCLSLRFISLCFFDFLHLIYFIIFLPLFTFTHTCHYLRYAAAAACLMLSPRHFLLMPLLISSSCHFRFVMPPLLSIAIFDACWCCCYRLPAYYFHADAIFFRWWYFRLFRCCLLIDCFTLPCWYWWLRFLIAALSFFFLICYFHFRCCCFSSLIADASLLIRDFHFDFRCRHAIPPALLSFIAFAAAIRWLLMRMNIIHARAPAAFTHHTCAAIRHTSCFMPCRDRCCYVLLCYDISLVFAFISLRYDGCLRRHFFFDDLIFFRWLADTLLLIIERRYGFDDPFDVYYANISFIIFRLLLLSLMISFIMLLFSIAFHIMPLSPCFHFRFDFDAAFIFYISLMLLDAIDGWFAFCWWCWCYAFITCWCCLLPILFHCFHVILFTLWACQLRFLMLDIFIFRHFFAFDYRLITSYYFLSLPLDYFDFLRWCFSLIDTADTFHLHDYYWCHCFSSLYLFSLCCRLFRPFLSCHADVDADFIFATHIRWCCRIIYADAAADADNIFIISFTFSDFLSMLMLSLFFAAADYWCWFLLLHSAFAAMPSLSFRDTLPPYMLPPDITPVRHFRLRRAAAAEIRRGCHYNT